VVSYVIVDAHGYFVPKKKSLLHNRHYQSNLQNLQHRPRQSSNKQTLVHQPVKNIAILAYAANVTNQKKSVIFVNVYWYPYSQRYSAYADVDVFLLCSNYKYLCMNKNKNSDVDHSINDYRLFSLQHHVDITLYEKQDHTTRAEQCSLGKAHLNSTGNIETKHLAHQYA
jgi:hypothetical protein